MEKKSLIHLSYHKVVLSNTHAFLHSQTIIHTLSNLVTISLSKHLNFRQFSLIKNTEIKTIL